MKPTPREIERRIAALEVQNQPAKDLPPVVIRVVYNGAPPATKWRETQSRHVEGVRDIIVQWPEKQAETGATKT